MHLQPIQILGLAMIVAALVTLGVMAVVGRRRHE